MDDNGLLAGRSHVGFALRPEAEDFVLPARGVELLDPLRRDEVWIEVIDAVGRANALHPRRAHQHLRLSLHIGEKHRRALTCDELLALLSQSLWRLWYRRLLGSCWRSRFVSRPLVFKNPSTVLRVAGYFSLWAQGKIRRFLWPGTGKSRCRIPLRAQLPAQLRSELFFCQLVKVRAHRLALFKERAVNLVPRI